MRNFEQRKAEVFRRSKARIQKRKRIINSIVLTAMPLILCLSVYAGSLLTAAPAGNPQSPEEDLIPATGGNQEITLQSCQITVEKGNFSYIETDPDTIQIETDPDTIQAVRSTIRDIFDGNLQSEIYSQPEDFASTTTSAGFRITIALEDGDESVYILSDRSLTDEASGIRRTLTTDEWTTLAKLLNIPQ